MSRASFSNWKILALAIIPLLFIIAFIQLQPDALETRQSPVPGLSQPETAETETADEPGEENPNIKSGGDTSFIVLDPETAGKYGVKGLILITLAPGTHSPGTPSETPASLTIERGQELNITIQLHFYSYKPDFNETVVKLNPKGRWGLSILKRAEDGSEVTLNDYVIYTPSGRVTLKANQTLPVTMTIRMPKELSRVNIALGAVGISADVPIISRVWGYIDVT